MTKAVVEGDARSTFQTLVDLGCIPRDTSLQPQRVLDWWAPIWDPGRGEQPFTFTSEFASWVIERNFDAFGEWGDVVRGMGIREESKDWAFFTRIQLGLYSVLAALQANCDWRTVHHELMAGGQPHTNLGRRHQTWKAARTRRPGRR